MINEYGINAYSSDGKIAAYIEQMLANERYPKVTLNCEFFTEREVSGERIQEVVNLIKKYPTVTLTGLDISCHDAHLHLKQGSKELEILTQIESVMQKQKLPTKYSSSKHISTDYTSNFNDFMESIDLVNGIADDANNLTFNEPDGSVRKATTLEKFAYITGRIHKELEPMEERDTRYMDNRPELKNWVGVTKSKKADSIGYACLLQAVCESTFGPNSKELLCLYQPMNDIKDRKKSKDIITPYKLNNLVYINDPENGVRGVYWVDCYKDAMLSKKNKEELHFDNFMVPYDRAMKENQVEIQYPTAFHRLMRCKINPECDFDYRESNEKIFHAIEDDVSQKSKDDLQTAKSRYDEVHDKWIAKRAQADLAFDYVLEELMKDPQISEMAKYEYYLTPSIFVDEELKNEAAIKLLYAVLPKKLKEQIKAINSFGLDEHTDIEELKKNLIGFSQSYREMAEKERHKDSDDRKLFSVGECRVRSDGTRENGIEEMMKETFVDNVSQKEQQEVDNRENDIHQKEAALLPEALGRVSPKGVTKEIPIQYSAIAIGVGLGLEGKELGEFAKDGIKSYKENTSSKGFLSSIKNSFSK